MDYELVNKDGAINFSEVGSLKFFYLNDPQTPYIKLPQTLQSLEGKQINAVSLKGQVMVYVPDSKQVFLMHDKVLLQLDPFEEYRNDKSIEL